MVKTQKQIQQIQDIHWSRDKRSRRHPNHPVVHAVFEPLADSIASNLNDPGRSSVLDVGCGNGFLQWSLEKRFSVVEGLDYSEQMLAVNPCQVKHKGSSTNLPFENGSFDLVVASNLLHHLSARDRRQTLLEMKRVAKRKVISFEPNRNNPFVFALSLITSEERMALNFSSAYMHNLFSQSGLNNVTTQVESWIAPNTVPPAWIPIGHMLENTVLKRIGLTICTIGDVNP